MFPFSQRLGYNLTTNREGIAMSEGPWFRARESGLGWTPITWEGWLVTVVSAALFIAADVAIVTHFHGVHH
jgi:hypothetical protein